MPRLTYVKVAGEWWKITASRWARKTMIADWVAVGPLELPPHDVRAAEKLAHSSPLNQAVDGPERAL